MIDADLIAAHKHSFSHRDEIESSELCGCFYCLAIFPPADIAEEGYWDETSPNKSEHTLFCPKCGIDAVIGSNAGYKIEKPFLKKMKKYFFY